MAEDFKKALRRELKGAEADLNEKLNSPDSPSYSPAHRAQSVHRAGLAAHPRARGGTPARAHRAAPSGAASPESPGGSARIAAAPGGSPLADRLPDPPVSHGR